MSDENVEVITPRNVLREKIGGKIPPIDPEAVVRAEAALEKLSVNFQDWMNEEAGRLALAFGAAEQARFDEDSLCAAYTRAHDVKGLAATYGYPLVTRLAHAFCRLIETPVRREAVARSPRLLQAAAAAIQAAVREQIKTEQHPAGRALASELDAKVDAAISLADAKEQAA